MAYYNDVTHKSDLLGRFYEVALRRLHAASQRRETLRIYYSTLAELDALSNRDLADLGLHRTELKRVAWNAAHPTDAK